MSVLPSCSWCGKSVLRETVYVDSRPFHPMCALAVLLAKRVDPLTEDRVREIVRDEIGRCGVATGYFY